MRLVENYQRALKEDPHSKVFAPLADAFRRLGQLSKAIEIAQKGVKFHPHFASGHVALGQALSENGDFEKAAVHLKQAAELSPENILAHLSLARVFLRIRESKQALAAFKMVLFLNPQQEEAIRAVSKLESLTADEFSEDLFSIHIISEPIPIPPSKTATLTKKTPTQTESSTDRHLLRKLSLLDAFIARNDLERAHALAVKLSSQYPKDSDIKRRREILEKHFEESAEEVAEPLKPLDRAVVIRTQQRHKLEKLLQKVIEWQKDLVPNEV